MAANAGPDIIEDGIVFYYDTDNTVKSFIGEPTTNLALDTLQQGGWPGTHTLISSGTKTFDLTTSTVEWGGDASWTMFYYDVTAYTGQHICLSATYEYSSSPGGGNLAFVMIGQTTGSQTYLGYSSPLDYNSVSPTPGQQISWNGVIGDGGKIGILTWMNNGNSTTLTSRFSKVQLEVKTHPTQFVNGTRSVTQGLLDMSGTKTINLTDVSFSPTAQITFDGTNDRITGGASTNYLPLPTHSLEAWIKSPGLGAGMGTSAIFGITYGLIVQILSGGTLHYYAYTTDNGSQVILFDLYSTGVNLFDNNWHHVVCTRDSSNVNIYIDGTLNSTTSNGGAWTGTNVWASMDMLIGNNPNNVYYYFNGSIDIAKIYSRGLSASEVLTNYNAFKTRFGI
jgi:hypothetical protein